MNIREFITKTNLEHSILVGFYGGGNYGDELLLETLSFLFTKAGVKDMAVAYQTPKTFAEFHKDYGYRQVTLTDYKSFMQALLRSKKIIIGGGGLWGMDVNRRIFFLAVMLWICRWLLGKKVYLLGVGYYNSTNILGRVSAFFAGKAANQIFARDQETFTNFSHISKHTFLDHDITWYLDTTKLESVYQADFKRLDQKLTVKNPTFVITLRRFQESHKNGFTESVETVIAKRPATSFIIMILEPRMVDPTHFKQMQQWASQHKNVQIVDFNFNPMALLLFFAAHKDKLVYVGPQFHGIISAHLVGMPFLPIAYDNKVSELIKQIDPTQQVIPIKQIESSQLMNFIDQYERG
jgi:polysaccharide pyruvyl transferase WcaK-like protein